ncbi:MAG: serine/threonine-protein phosphatase [Bacteroidetes bacterium]|nr:serine/threonine-protein phosphatase [Bacteroidota bacterium]MBT7144507.1 serine/threonine-protein phosphatase [Bacteroidota bacterium]MBT7493074.1 serine/threonine-protein phosphatase [Bacteroidota bacterium]
MISQVENSNIWALIIDENAVWAINYLEKVKKIASSTIPAYLFISNFSKNINIEGYFDIGVNGFVHKHESSEIVSHQINAIVEREKEIKDKYLNALNLAANASPIRFENSIDQKIGDISISILHEPFNEIPGGDFYEVFDLNDKKLIILGDVMGKKWGAWFFVLAYIAYIRSTVNFFANNPEVEFSSNPEKLLEIINQYIYKDLQLSEVFTTLSVIVVDTEKSSIKISSAGAMRPFFYNHTNEKMRQLNIVGTLLGVIDSSKYQSVNIDIKKGDKLLIFTDGYSEAKASKTGKEIGEIALLNAFNSRRQKDVVSCQQIENEIIEEFNISSFDDDRTMLLICKS